MIEVKNLQDIKKFEKNNMISSSFAIYLKDYLSQLKESLENHVSIEDFDLTDHGHFVILKNHEDCRNVPELVLEEELGELLSIIPEFVNEIVLDNGKKYFLIAVSCNNEFMLIIYLPLPCPDEISTYFKSYIVK